MNIIIKLIDNSKFTLDVNNTISFIKQEIENKYTKTNI
jgi:hypothetical protein